ncbi:MAG: hypothetical protein KDK65_04030 [Chlamydiia bacterium]|nr:hypothetical protein [Chlamydiia bacterium]
MTRALFKVASTGQCQLFAAIRAHQHAPTNALMQQLLKRKGCVKLWHAYNGDDVSLTAGSVLTMLLTPDSDSGITERERQQFTFDTTLIVTTGAAIQDWCCQRINHPVFH